MDRKLTSSELKKLNSKKALRSILSREPINIERTLRYVDYERKLIKLQMKELLYYLKEEMLQVKVVLLEELPKELIPDILELQHFKNQQKMNKHNGIFNVI
jgi:hypothetical protein